MQAHIPRPPFADTTFLHMVQDHLVCTIWIYKLMVTIWKYFSLFNILFPFLFMFLKTSLVQSWFFPLLTAQNWWHTTAVLLDPTAVLLCSATATTGGMLFWWQMHYNFCVTNTFSKGLESYTFDPLPEETQKDRKAFYNTAHKFMLLIWKL